MRTKTRPVPVAIATDTALAYLVGSGDRNAIASGCDELGLDLRGYAREADGDDSRPELQRALDLVAEGEVGCLVVRRLTDLSRGGGGLAAVLDRVDAEALRLIALDVGLDTAAPSGRVALARHPRPDLPWAPRPEAEPDDTLVIEDADDDEDAEPPEDEYPYALISVVPDPEPIAAAEVPVPDPDPAPDPPSEPPPDPAPEPPNLHAAPELPAAPPATVPAIGYASAAGLANGAAAEALTTQREAIETRCVACGFHLVELVGDREPKAAGRALDRPGLSHALQRIAAREASCLVVSGLDRLSHSVAELGQIVRWLERHQIRLVALDLDLDTSTEAGRTTARALASVGDWERERLSERTRAGLAAARAKRHSSTGARAGEFADLHKRIAAMRADGMTLQKIADVLNEEGVPTLRGGAKWRPSSVQSAAGYRRPTRARTVDRLPQALPKAPDRH
jgi:DNA invertase Pin-like site-specific DNA recombinase